MKLRCVLEIEILFNHLSLQLSDIQSSGVQDSWPAPDQISLMMQSPHNECDVAVGEEHIVQSSRHSQEN